MYGCVGPDLEDGAWGVVLVCVWVVGCVVLGWLGLWLVGLLRVFDLCLLSLHLGHHLVEVSHLLFDLAHAIIHYVVCLVSGVDDFVFALYAFICVGACVCFECSVHVLTEFTDE